MKIEGGAGGRRAGRVTKMERSIYLFASALGGGKPLDMSKIKLLYYRVSRYHVCHSIVRTPVAEAIYHIVAFGHN